MLPLRHLLRRNNETKRRALKSLATQGRRKVKLVHQKITWRRENVATEIQRMKQQVSLLRVVQAKVQRFERRGNEYWASCPLPGHQGTDRTPSFAIKVKDGCEVYFCQGCGQGGDIITWYQNVDGLTKAQAIEKLKTLTFNPDMSATLATNQADAEKYNRVGTAFPNIVDNDNKPKRKLPTQEWLPFEADLATNDRALIWLHHMRGITKQTAVDLHLGYSNHCAGHLDPENEGARDAGWILFPRFDDERKHVIACKARSISIKAFSQWTGMDPKALFNAGSANALEDLFVTEGEFDTCIMEQCGFRAVSIPNASTKLTPDMK